MLKEVIATYDPDIIVLYDEHWQGCGVICNMIVNRISKEVRNLLHEVYILFHGFGNVGNFAIFKGTAQGSIMGTSTPEATFRKTLNVPLIFRVGCI
jgi:hypothetical protein